jgi:tetratricopeptide (TPR) repeat protein
MQSAKRYLAQAVKVNGDYFKSRLGLGYVYLQLKDSSKAVPQLEASMKLMPTAPGAYFLAQGYEQTGKTQQAVDLYGQLAQADATGKYGQAATARLKALGVK